MVFDESIPLMSQNYVITTLQGTKLRILLTTTLSRQVLACSLQACRINSGLSLSKTRSRAA